MFFLLFVRTLYFIIAVAAAFQFYSTKEGNVTVIQGQKKILQCIVKSFPQSNIFWEGSIGINAYTVKMEKTEYKKEITTKSIFILDSPTRNHDGKKVVCVVRPTYGAILQRRFTLIYKSGRRLNIRCFWLNVTCQRPLFLPNM